MKYFGLNFEHNCIVTESCLFDIKSLFITLHNSLYGHFCATIFYKGGPTDIAKKMQVLNKRTFLSPIVRYHHFLQCLLFVYRTTHDSLLVHLLGIDEGLCPFRGEEWDQLVNRKQFRQHLQGRTSTCSIYSSLYSKCGNNE